MTESAKFDIQVATALKEIYNDATAARMCVWRMRRIIRELQSWGMRPEAIAVELTWIPVMPYGRKEEQEGTSQRGIEER